jgi:hypothetical protein
VRAQLVTMVFLIGACGGAAPEPKAAEPAPVTEPAPVAPEPAPPPSAPVRADMSPGSDAGNVQAVMKAHMAELVACYEDVLRTKPGIEGRVDATFTIEADGRVTSADAVGVDGAVDACIIYLLESLRFPPMKTRAVIKYPLVFKRTGTAPAP